MANRSYLYSVNAVPEMDARPRSIIGLSEWNYDIPVLYKILASGNARLSKSVIWKTDDRIAILGDYDLGLKKASSFLAQITRSDWKPIVQESLRFLGDPKNRQEFFLLEGCEIFDMNDDTPPVQNERLLSEICAVDSFASQFISKFNAADQRTAKEMGNEIGAENWSNSLYYNFSAA